MATPTKSLIVTALHAEAEPLIQRFGLKKETAARGAEVYRKEDAALIVTGVGKVRSAVAAASFLARLPDVSCLAVFNIGIAAGNLPGASIGDLFLIHKILDNASGRELFPDVLLEIGLREGALTTVDKPLTSPEEDLPKGLVDMEGAGFFEAASSFLPPHRIFCLKVISDFMDGVRLTKKQISALVSRHADEVARLVTLAESLCTSEPPVLGSREQRWMERVTEALCPTVSQRRQLEEQVSAYVVCKSGTLPKLDSRLLETPSSKRERSERLEAIRRRLAV